MLLEMHLQELRKARKQSHAKIGRKLKIKQAAISRVESRTDIYQPYDDLEKVVLAVEQYLNSIVANRVAERIVSEADEVEEVYCFMVSQIGKPVDEPQSVEVKLSLPSEALLPAVTPQVSQIIESTLAEMTTLWKEVLEGGISVY